MKKAAVLLSAIFAMAMAYGQKVKATEVPSAVKAAFQKHFPDAKNIRWEKEDGNFEAGFVTGKAESSALLDASGRLLETEQEIAAALLPAGASAFVAKTYPGKKIKETTRITDAAGVVTYEIEVNGKDLFFDKEGNLIKEEVKKEND